MKKIKEPKEILPFTFNEMIVNCDRLINRTDFNKYFTIENLNQVKEIDRINKLNLYNKPIWEALNKHLIEQFEIARVKYLDQLTNINKKYGHKQYDRERILPRD
jgi:hypothetical protein